jgi:hypothetical protein
MLLSRFDQTRLRAVAPGEVTARTCDGTRLLVQACRLGAGPATRPAVQPWQPPRIEWPFGVYHVASAEVARRSCLQLDGSWSLADVQGAAGRLRIRAQALAADLAWWRPLAARDAWDAGVARSVAGLRGFRPRRASLIVVDQAPLTREDFSVLQQLEAQAWAWPRALRVVVVGGEVPALARPLAT